jgi:two-component system sensor histidine kinase PhcS
MARLKATEAQLVQSEKMNALGSLSAGLLHEINNPLNFTLTAVQVAQELLDGRHGEVDEVLRDIKDGMMRISDIVTGLRTFAYPDRGEASDEFEVAEALDTALRFTAHQCEGVAIERDFAEGAPIRCSKTHVVQVFVNLVSNSLKAVEEIRGDRKPIIKVASRREGCRLVVQVRDNGVGVEQDNLPRVFDPFFTTSEVGKGMGLGLSICHTIIVNQGGTMKAESRLNEGTTMTYDNPLAKDDTSHAA